MMFRQWLHETLAEMYPGQAFDVLVPPDAAMGDYSVNLAFVVAQSEKKNPREVAQVICDAVSAQGGEMIERCEVAGPGFVNVFLKDSYLQGQLGNSEIPSVGAGKKVIIEYPSTNVAKPMHVGHSRPAFIGDALSRVYQALGYEVIRWDHLGDWGTQFGMILAAYKMWGDKEVVATHPLQALNELYVKYRTQAKEQPELEQRARDEFKKLEEKDIENTELWQEFKDLSLKESHAMYHRLGLLPSHQEVGESFYLPQLPALVAELQEKGIAKLSEGAIVVDLEQFRLPTALIQKSDGASVYLTRDIASLEYRITQENPAKILYVVGNEQALHLEQLFAVAQLAKLNSSELVHVKYGLILGENGTKLSTREGTAILLADVIDKVTAMAAERNPETAEVIGIGALKYNDLRQHPHSDIVFNWEQMLDLGGNSGPYLQYTYARLASIVTKAANKAVKGPPLQLTHPVERAMMRHMLDFGYAVAECAHLYALNGLALYLYELANLSNRYYEAVRINDDEDAARKAARVELITAVMAQLKKGLELLGIQALERI